MDHNSDDSPSPINNKKRILQRIGRDEIKNVQSNPMIIKQNECSACHILFKLADKM